MDAELTVYVHAKKSDGAGPDTAQTVRSFIGYMSREHYVRRRASLVGVLFMA